MRQGFIFNIALCVNCKACSAACMLENDWRFPARKIFTRNSEALAEGPVLNISMACNHCQNPACLTGCPTAAYYRDESTGAVLLNPDRCIGCRYCTWNCPYGAPVFNCDTGVIEKCSFCNDLQKEGYDPSCATACPTGALSFGPVGAENENLLPDLVPDKGLKPALVFSNPNIHLGPEVIPSVKTDRKKERAPDERKIGEELSLALFSFLALVSVSVTVSGLLKDFPNTGFLPLSLIILSSVISVFHLRSKHTAWRAVINVRNSPLSREISVLAAYGATLLIILFTDLPVWRITASVTGMLLLFAIDEVYNFSSGRSRFHSGTAFLSALQIISFLTDSVAAFIFVAALRIVLMFAGGALTKEGRTWFATRFHRLALLVIVSFSLLAGTGINQLIILIILLVSEFAGRILFYLDFDPENIEKKINTYNIHS
jgi:Fe-S-cluster-containing dehydrogenase component